jgi:hypothetical protein
MQFKGASDTFLSVKSEQIFSLVKCEKEYDTHWEGKFFPVVSILHNPFFESKTVWLCQWSQQYTQGSSDSFS